MLILPIDEAEPGVKLAMSVQHPEHPDQELLKPGYIIDKPVLDKLRKMNIEYIWVDYPDLADLDRHLIPLLSPARHDLYCKVRDTFHSLEKGTRPTVTFPDYYAATRELILVLMRQGNNLVYLDMMIDRFSGDEIAHCAAVAHLSLVLGIRLEQYLINQRQRLSAGHAREVVNLGVAGMLHDIGKVRLPTELRHYHSLNQPTDAQELTDWRTHARIGYDMLRTGIECSASAAVLQHHENFDGSGFPAVVRARRRLGPLCGEEIHVFGRILAAANLYDRCAVDAAGKRQPAIIAHHMLRTVAPGWIDPVILKILPSVLPPFPPSARVQLSDGTTALVTDIPAATPYWPTVRRLKPGTWTLQGEPINLSEHKDHLHITSVEGVSTDGLIPRDPPATSAAA